MEDILCDISAFRAYRIPPQVLLLCPVLPERSRGRNWKPFLKHILIEDAIGSPVHLVASQPSKRTGASTVAWHLIPEGVPPGHISDTPTGACITSPELTLFQLAQSLPQAQALMAMYEFCGSFTVFEPSPRIEWLLKESTDQGLLPPDFGWRRVRDNAGKPTSLWMRPPLASPSNLLRFARQVEGTRGSRPFEQTAKLVTGRAASPFEVQASMLFSLPRSKGGEGFQGLANNDKIPLSREARFISGKTCCYTDISFSAAAGITPLVIECQGKMVHDNFASAISDADRIVALQQMGYDVMPITFGQIAKPDNFDAVRRIVARKLGLSYREKTSTQVKRERELREQLFMDWRHIGSRITGGSTRPR